MKIFLVRHGESTSDIEDRYGGSFDDDLTERGKAQLASTAEKLTGKGIEVIYSSPLKRATQAADILAAKLNCPVEIVRDMRERHYGVLTGLTKAEAKERYPQAVEAHKDPRTTDPEGEGLSEFQQRVLASFQDIVRRSYDVVALVTHGGPIKQILAYVGKEVPLRIADGEILQIDVEL